MGKGTQSYRGAHAVLFSAAFGALFWALLALVLLHLLW
jgi:hypothetical protein